MMHSVRFAKFEDVDLISQIMITSFRTAFAEFVTPRTMEACTNPGNCRRMLDQIYLDGGMRFLLCDNQ